MLTEKSNLDLQNELALTQRLCRMQARIILNLRNGRDTPDWVHRRIEQTETALVPYRQAAILRVAEFLHPNGRCTCCGEGRCEWCLRHPDPGGEDDAVEPARCHHLASGPAADPDLFYEDPCKTCGQYFVDDND